MVARNAANRNGTINCSAALIPATTTTKAASISSESAAGEGLDGLRTAKEPLH